MESIGINTYDLTLEECIELLPDFFYKYTKIGDNLKKNLVDGQLWFATPNTFNDPFDCKAHLNFGSNEEECRENFNKFNEFFKIKLPETHQMVWDVLLKNPVNFNLINSYSAYSNIIDVLGITCFSEIYNSTLMWSHYADNHKGLVLEFAKDTNNGILTRNLLPVNYFESFPIINISDYPIEQMLAIIYQIICAKGKDWIYEREWRAISTNANCLNNFNKSELVGIIFGLNTSDEDKKEIFSIISTSGYTNVKFREAVFEQGKFSTEYKDFHLS